MKKWEYYTHHARTTLVDDVLDRVGKAGWELIGFFGYPSQTNPSFTYIFKREI